MSTTMTPPPPTKPDPARHMLHAVFSDSTPVRLRLFLVLNCLAAILFSFFAGHTIARHEGAVRTIGKDAAPSILEAHQMKDGAVRMASDLAIEMITAPGDERSFVVQDFEKWRGTVSKQLVAAAENITYGRAEQGPIEDFQKAFGEFQMKCQRARDFKELNDQKNAMLSYHEALVIVNDRLCKSADELNKANSEALEKAYTSEESGSALSSGMVLVIGLLVTAVLAATQLYMVKHFRRRINIPLLIATLATVGASNQLYSTLRENAEHLKVAKKEAFDSMVAMLEARSDLFEANAALIHGIADPGDRDKEAKIFAENSGRLATVSSGTLKEAFAKAQELIDKHEKAKVPELQGSIATALENISFEGERDAVQDLLEPYQGYIELCDKIKSADATEATQLALGYRPNESQFYFQNFDEAAERVLRINRDHFEDSVQEAASDLNGMVAISEALVWLLIICTYLGLRPRMAEYIRQ